MEPFIKKMKKLQHSKKGKKSLPKKGDWAFLRDWESPIGDDNLEVLSEQGKTDARVCLLVKSHSMWCSCGVELMKGIGFG